MLQAPDDLPVCSSGGVCVHNQYNSQWEYTNDVNPDDPTRLDQIISAFRSRYADTVSLSVLPAMVVAQILFMGVVSLYQVMSHQRSVLTQIWAYRCQNGRMQPLYLAQITYHLAFNSNSYYLGLSTGTLSNASVVNLSLSFFAFNYSFINLLRATSGEQVLDRNFRIPWENLQLVTTSCVAAVLLSLRMTSLAFIGEMNGELLRRTSRLGAKYCGLNDSCYIFTVNLVFVVAFLGIMMGLTAHVVVFLQQNCSRIVHHAKIRVTQSPNTTAIVEIRPNSNIGDDFVEAKGNSPGRPQLTSFERHCLGGKFTRLFHDCGDLAYVTLNGKKCTTVEALLLCGYLFYGDHVYQANSVVLLLVARVLPRKVIRTFNVIVLRWRVDPERGALSQIKSCTWFDASTDNFIISEAVPVA
jgi:hypothetical protein